MNDVTQVAAGRELDALVAEKVMGMVPCGAWRYANLGSAGGPVSMNDSGDCEHGHGKCYPADPELPFGGPPRFSEQIAAAWQVVEKMHELGWSGAAEVPFALERNYGDGAWTAFFDGPHGQGHVLAATAPLAICRAALLAVETPR